ncbi:MAG: outer membrane beta-barrel protein [Rhodospirillales bacterium]|nr:outer membrane beta-barrel protein [Rhodospirillales bacterium]
MNKTRAWTGCIVFALSALAVSEAYAQAAAQIQPLTPREPESEAARGETVITRQRPELDPLGIRAGSFLIYPKLGVEETYNDNVFAVRHQTKDDFITDIKPEISAESNWSNHALNFGVGADSGVYADFGDLNYNDWFVRSDGRIDITRDAAVFLGGGFAHEHEDPGEPDAATDAKKPTQYDLINGIARYIQTFGRLRATGEAGIIRLDYDQTDLVGGGEQSNTGRDRNVYTEGVRIGYELSPAYEAFVRVDGNQRVYDTRQDGSGVERNSTGVTSVAGVSLDLGGIVFGDVFAGYLGQYFNDNSFNDVNGFTAGGTMTWNVTTLTTLNARVARTIQDTTQAGSPAFLRTSGGLSADHELLRNLILTATATVTNDNYEDVNRNDYYYITGIGARYLMNRNIYANIGYQFVRHTSNGSDTTDDSYYQNMFRIGLEAQL